MVVENRGGQIVVGQLVIMFVSVCAGIVIGIWIMAVADKFREG